MAYSNKFATDIKLNILRS